jgi:hypothetical protein
MYFFYFKFFGKDAEIGANIRRTYFLGFIYFYFWCFFWKFFKNKVKNWIKMSIFLRNKIEKKI